MESARLSFTAVGFSATTTERVASQSGTTPRSVMHRFADKDALLYAVVDRWLSARLADILAPAATLNDPMERLRGVCREMLLAAVTPRLEEHTSELQSIMRISYAAFCLKKKK